MGKQPAKITLSPSRDIPFDQLVLSQSNVRRIKAGVSIPELADDIARRTLLQSLNVRPVLDEDGAETGMFEVPAGGRRYRALELLVKQKRLARTALVPCIVKAASTDISAEEDSYAENAVREQLHPLDQFRAMQAMIDKGSAAEDIAAHFGVTPAVVRQRLADCLDPTPAMHAPFETRTAVARAANRCSANYGPLRHSRTLNSICGKGSEDVAEKGQEIASLGGRACQSPSLC